MSNYKGLFTFDVNNHRYVSVDQADGIIDFMYYQPEIKEEQKGYWYINEFGTPTEITHTRENIYDKQRKNFGNYFETAEEAEKAVGKIKTFTKLCKKGFEFNDVEMFGSGLIRIEASIPINEKTTLQQRSDITDSLYLLFGGEE